jgi:hypothetical protein
VEIVKMLSVKAVQTCGKDIVDKEIQTEGLPPAKKAKMEDKETQTQTAEGSTPRSQKQKRTQWLWRVWGVKNSLVSRALGAQVRAAAANVSIGVGLKHA